MHHCVIIAGNKFRNRTEHYSIYSYSQQDLRIGAFQNMFFIGSFSIWKTKNTLFKTDTSMYATFWFTEFITLFLMIITESFFHLFWDIQSGISFQKSLTNTFSHHIFTTCLQLEPLADTSHTIQFIINFINLIQKMLMRILHK